jgi:hypothetical protein
MLKLFTMNKKALIVTVGVGIGDKREEASKASLMR